MIACWPLAVVLTDLSMLPGIARADEETGAQQRRQAAPYKGCSISLCPMHGTYSPHKETRTYCKPTSTKTRPEPDFKSVMALPTIAPRARREFLTFIAYPGRPELVRKSPG